MAEKITFNDKSHVIPYGTREIQIWDLDINEIKAVVNANADLLTGLEGGYQGVLLIADTPTEDGYYMAGESGTFTNTGGLVVDLNNGITFINVSDTQTVFTQTVIPLATTDTVTEGSTDLITSGGAYNKFLQTGNKIFYAKNTTKYITQGDGVSYQNFTIQDNSIILSYVNSAGFAYFGELQAGTYEFTGNYKVWGVDLTTGISNGSDIPLIEKSYTDKSIFKGDDFVPIAWIWDSNTDKVSFNSELLRFTTDYVSIDSIQSEVFEYIDDNYIPKSVIAYDKSDSVIGIDGLDLNFPSTIQIQMNFRDGGFGYFSLPDTFSFSENYSCIGIDVSGTKPSSNGDDVTLTEYSLFSGTTLDQRFFIPLASYWNGTVILAPILQPFKSNASEDYPNINGLNVLALGDSIWDKDLYSTSAIEQAKALGNFTLNNVCTGGAGWNDEFQYIATTLVSSTSSATVTDTGGQFQTLELQAGYKLYSHVTYLLIGEISSVESETSLTLTANAEIDWSERYYYVRETSYPNEGTTSTIQAQTSYFSNQIRKAIRLIEAGTYQDPDLIMIALGTNRLGAEDGDFNTIISYDTYLDMPAEYLRTTNGGMRNGIEWLMNLYPNAKIIICTPRQAGEGSGGRTYVGLQNRRNLMEVMSNYYSTPIIDYFNELGIVSVFENDSASGRYLVDGVHPNTDGQTLETNFLLNKMNLTYSSIT